MRLPTQGAREEQAGNEDDAVSKLTRSDGPRVRESTTTKFYDELEFLINRYSQENHSDTPDFILASYIRGCLEAFESAVRRRDSWYGDTGRKPWHLEVDKSSEP